jgi:hypothetical protein
MPIYNRDGRVLKTQKNGGGLVTTGIMGVDEASGIFLKLWMDNGHVYLIPLIRHIPRSTIISLTANAYDFLVTPKIGISPFVLLLFLQMLFCIA